MNFVKLKQGSSEWLELRRMHGGSSEAACIMGCAKYQPDTWLKLWRLKAGKDAPQKQNPAMARGLAREPITRASVVASMGMDFSPAIGVMGHLIGSFDGISPDGKTILEIKNPMSAEGDTWKAALRGEIEPHYMAQIQHLLLVSGADKCLFVVDVEGEPHWTSVVLPDLYYRTLLVHQWATFWKHIEEFSPPAASDGDITPMLGDDWILAASRYRTAIVNLKAAEIVVDEAKKSLIAMCDGHSACQGQGLRVQNVFRKGTVDYAKVPELTGLDLEQYRKKGVSSWRIDDVKG